jgi:hypothetical protein
MSRVEELITILADKDVVARSKYAKALHICKICGNRSTFFRTPQAAFEYRISMICQSCQDYFLA